MAPEKAGHWKMDKAILIDSDREHAQRLMQSLRRLRLQITLCLTISEASFIMRKCPIKVVILVPDLVESWRDAVDDLSSALDPESDSTLKMCLLRKPYTGPDERLAGKRLGWRVLYE